MQDIPNERLEPEVVPAADADWRSIGAFARTFNGDFYAGSPARAAEIAGTQRHNTLSELRTCLFYEWRRYRAVGIDPDERAMGYVRELLDKIRRKLEQDERD
jgi:hypothetical protein